MDVTKLPYLSLVLSQLITSNNHLSFLIFITRKPIHTDTETSIGPLQIIAYSFVLYSWWVQTSIEPISEMTLINLSSLSPWLSRLSHSSPPLPIITTNATNALLFRIQTTSINFSKLLTTKASLGESESGSGLAEDSVSELLDDELLSKVSGAKDAQEALQMIAEITGRNGGLLSASDCCAIVSAALKRKNPDLALSVFYEMRASFDQGIGLGFNISCSCLED